MNTLEDRFVQTIRALDLPQRDLEGAVLAQLASTTTRSHRKPTWALALAAIAIAVIGIVAVPPARHAVANWLGIGATAIEIVPDVPSTNLPGSTAPPSADDIGQPIEPVEDDLLNPLPGLGSPLGVFDDFGRGRSFTWSALQGLPELGDTGVGAVLSIRPADRELATKRVAIDVTVEFVGIQVDGRNAVGLWIGGTHELVAAGASRPVTAENVLLWVHDGLEYRLELNGSKQDAIVLAQTVEGGTELLPAE